MHFYNDVTKLHAMTEQSEIDEVAKQVCTDYFGLEQEEMRLNVNLGTRNKVLKALEHPTTTMFDEAYNDIEQVLKVRYQRQRKRRSKAVEGLRARPLEIERHARSSAKVP